MTEREKIAARIRALLQKTVENGCTEDEAIAAAAKAAEMLERYNLTVDEVEMRTSPFGRHTEQFDDLVGARAWKVAASISKLTGAAYWVSRPGTYPVEVNFFGFEHEVQVAGYLLEICTRAMRQAEVALNQSFGLLVLRIRHRKITAFLDGMSDRLARRILEQIPPRPAGTGLVVLRDQLVKQAMNDAGIETDAFRARSSKTYEPTYDDGVAAADRVALNRGLSGGQTTAGLLS